LLFTWLFPQIVVSKSYQSLCRSFLRLTEGTQFFRKSPQFLSSLSISSGFLFTLHVVFGNFTTKYKISIDSHVGCSSASIGFIMACTWSQAELSDLILEEYGLMDVIFHLHNSLFESVWLFDCL
jgi:hypothetical protein